MFLLKWGPEKLTFLCYLNRRGSSSKRLCNWIRSALKQLFPMRVFWFLKDGLLMLRLCEYLAQSSLRNLLLTFSLPVPRMEPHLKAHNTDVYHTKYAEVLASMHDFSGAYRHFNIALKINSDSQKAKDGLARMEKRMADEDDEEEAVELMDDDDDGL